MIENQTIRSARFGAPVRRIGPVNVEVASAYEAVKAIVDAVADRSCAVFAFCNMHTLNSARRQQCFAAALARTTLLNDGLALDVASILLFGAPFPSNLNGTDLTPTVLRSLQPGTRVYLLGGLPGVAKESAERLALLAPSISIVGTHHGYFGISQSSSVTDDIREKATDLVLVGMGHPRQELWAVENAIDSGAVVMCVGAFLDFSAGRVSRAPRLVRAVRCEWLYRLALEPRRLTRRYLGGAVPFLWAILYQKSEHIFRQRQPLLNFEQSWIPQIVSPDAGPAADCSATPISNGVADG